MNYEWKRGEEHEGMLTMFAKDGGVRMTITFPWRDKPMVERWMVETFKVWPHPESPHTPDEFEYPAYRNRAYAALHKEDAR